MSILQKLYNNESNDGILYIKESEKKEQKNSYLMELLEQWVFFKNDA
jgi:hypothetical protein